MIGDSLSSGVHHGFPSNGEPTFSQEVAEALFQRADKILNSHPTVRTGRIVRLAKGLEEVAKALLNLQPLTTDGGSDADYTATSTSVDELSEKTETDTVISSGEVIDSDYDTIASDEGSSSITAEEFFDSDSSCSYRLYFPPDINVMTAENLSSVHPKSKKRKIPKCLKSYCWNLPTRLKPQNMGNKLRKLSSRVRGQKRNNCRQESPDPREQENTFTTYLKSLKFSPYK